jgi:asparagine synthase (glutamine-hydrolysing)
MACSLEVRVPLLAHQIVEFAAGVPWSLKMRRGSSKWLLKELMRPTLGAEVVDRPKQGFCMPVGQWLRGPLRSMAGDLLLGGGGATGEWLNRTRIEGLWRQHQTGRRNYESTLWALLMLELWAGRVLRGADVRASANEGKRVEFMRGAHSCGSQA